MSRNTGFQRKQKRVGKRRKNTRKMLAKEKF